MASSLDVYNSFIHDNNYSLWGYLINRPADYRLDFTNTSSIHRLNMPLQYLFVYGTLLSSADSVWHDRLIAPHFKLAGRARVRGRLYSLGEYPGLIEVSTHEDQVPGELYSFDAENHALEDLDDYEGCSSDTPLPHEYVRKLTEVRLDDGSRLTAWCYFYVGDTRGLKVIRAWSGQ